MLKVKTTDINADYGTIFATALYAETRCLWRVLSFYLFVLSASMNLVIIASPRYNSSIIEYVFLISIQHKYVLSILPI